MIATWNFKMIVIDGLQLESNEWELMNEFGSDGWVMTDNMWNDL